jgi:hypothetical protein
MKTTKIKVFEATVSQLDWLLVKQHGMDADRWLDTWKRPELRYLLAHPTTDPVWMNKITEKEGISTTTIHDGPAKWAAYLDDGQDNIDSMMFGHTSLVAAARCHIVSELGPIVEVPTVLVETTPMDSQDHSATDEQTADPAPGQ